jgi:transcriptional regulator with XRE-family HTH domain
MRDVPQLKLVREDQGWSQRDLAARSGVAPNTISQLERGERQAMPSTVRKLANALGVDPPILMAQTSRQPAEQVGRSGSEEASRGGEELRNRYSHQARQPRATSDIGNLVREFGKEQYLVRKEWYETGRWAEFYVSGELVKRVRAFAEAHDAASIFSDGSGGYVVDFLSEPEQQYLEATRNALRSYKGDLAAVRSRLVSHDPKEAVIAAQTVMGSAKKIVEEHEGYLESFRRVPDRYYADPEAHDRILQLERALLMQREAAAEDIRKLMDLYDECLDTLQDQLVAMREEGDVLESFVRQA